MYSRKPTERDLLHRLSHINDIHKKTMLLSRDIKDARMESMSMQEAIARYMQCAMAEIIPQTNEEKRVLTGEEEAKKARNRAMAIVEVCQISNQRREDAKERTKDQRERQRKSPGVPVGRIPEMEEEIVIPQTPYDKLDENRCAGFLLYSYDRYGAHSVLGEHHKTSGYGGQMSKGDFGKKV